MLMGSAFELLVHGAFADSQIENNMCWAQAQMDVAVAIVMAPRDRQNRCGIFRLSTPGGFDLVKGCTRRGFHMHPTPETGQSIYELCGHVYLNPRIQHEVIDLR